MTASAFVLSSLVMAPQAALAEAPSSSGEIVDVTETFTGTEEQETFEAPAEVVTEETPETEQAPGSETPFPDAEESSEQEGETGTENQSPAPTDTDSDFVVDPSATIPEISIEDEVEVEAASTPVAGAVTGSCSSWETEKRGSAYANDDKYDATPATVGATLCGYISSNNDEDFYGYNISTPGRYSVGFTFPSLTSPNADETYKIRLHNSRGDAVRTWDLNRSARDGAWLAKQVVQLPAGDWYISVDSRHNQVNDIAYKVKLSKTNANVIDTAPTAAGCRAEHENRGNAYANDDKYDATPATVGATLCGYISSNNDEDFYEYNIPASQVGSYTLNFKFNSLGQTQYPEAYSVSLHDSRGDALKTWRVGTGMWKGKNFKFNLPAGASYVKIDSDHDQVNSNQYRLNLTRIGGPANTGGNAKTTFVDVPKNHKFFKEIQWMYTSKATTGIKTSNGLTYAPKGKVTREAMAAFLYRQNAAKSYKPKKQHFADVPKNHKFYKEIEWMYDQGLSTGIRKNGKVYYAPKDGVSREAMAAFMYRLQGPKNGKAPASAPFADVNRGHKFAKEIAWMKSSGLSTGTRRAGGAVYQPKSTVTREAMAAFLYRAK